MNSPTVKSEDVIQFWFGAVPPTDEAALKSAHQWFTKSDAFDTSVRQRFLATVEAALKGDLDEWANEPQGWLALLIVLDQFPRNIYRGQPASFSGDAAALRWAQQGKSLGWDRRLPLMARPFAYLPFEHAEDMVQQNHSVADFQALLGEAGSAQSPEPVMESMRSYLAYAESHREVIQRFGRFPHRNAILGRSCTPEELEYLSQPGAGF